MTSSEKIFISSAAERFSPLFSAVEKYLSFSDAPLLVGIDGDCGAGKSTLGALLRDTFGGNLFHADDYFLPPELRTEARLNTPGGNMHRERLLSEVLLPISRGEAAVTRRFDCASQSLGGKTEHPKRRLNIVEGSYCLHPELRGFYTLRVFLKTSPENQRARICAREGKASYARFENVWIPLEKAYFSACGAEECAELVFET